MAQYDSQAKLSEIQLFIVQYFLFFSFLQLKEEYELSLQRIFEALIGLGFSEADSRVYIKIAVNGPMTAKTLIEELKITKQQLYPILKKLRNQRIIKMTDMRPFVISALPFEVVLQMLIDRKFDESKEILENKEELLACWKAVNWNNGT